MGRTVLDCLKIGEKRAEKEAHFFIILKSQRGCFGSPFSPFHNKTRSVYNMHIWEKEFLRYNNKECCFAIRHGLQKI